VTKTVVAIGEALWDVFPDQRRPGGAPCNVACHAARLGDRGVIITRVGRDAAGEDLVAFLRGRGVDTVYVQRDEVRSTGSVAVTIEDSDPRYVIAEDVAWDQMTAEDDARALVSTADAVCVGSLAQRHEPSRAAIRQLLSEARGQALVIFDVNLRPPFIDPEAIEDTLKVADVIKLSEAEVAQISALLDKPALIQWLLQDAGVQAVCVTRGKSGASITTLEGTVSTPAVEVDTSAGDAVGAGDAFTAAMIHRLIRNATPQEALEAANRYAALVATKKGAVPSLASAELAAIGL
jgi:fructokinase